MYTLRVNMSVACVDMADDLNWTDAEKGLVLVSYGTVQLAVFITSPSVLILLGLCDGSDS